MTAQDPKQRLLAWRAEIAAELDVATKALPALEVAHETAAAAAQATAEDYRDTQRLLVVIDRPESPIRLRADWHRQELEQAKSNRGRALSDLEAARAKVTELQRALAQIDRVIPPADEELAAS